MKKLIYGACIGALFAIANSAQAQSVAEFYKDRTISITVGYGAGGGYDVYARSVARHMGRRSGQSAGCKSYL
jgi:tripartite-type tricarboxylate transporter receptor subunit TctC